MDRLACVDLPAFPLQLLIRSRPQWAGLPVVVVAEDRPGGRVLWASEQARAARILPGHRYAQALSLCADVRAGVLDREQIAAGVDEVVERLRGWAPEVEPAPGEPGVAWLDASGLGRLYPSLRRWARALIADLRAHGLDANVAVGFTRFGSYAVARGDPGGGADLERAGGRERGARERPRGAREFRAREAGRVVVFDDPAGERRAARAVPLARLDMHPDVRDALARLGVHTLGALASLPGGGVLERFGPEAYGLHQLATGARWDPLCPRPVVEPNTQRIALDCAERDTGRLLFAIKRGLDPVLARLAADHRALATLFLDYALERRWSARGDGDDDGDSDGGDARRHLDVIRPAEPTLDPRGLLRLVHLRLESRPPPAAVVEIEIAAEAVVATGEQLSLFARAPRRDLRAGNEALAQLRAELGNDAVCVAVLRDGHLPEARYGWEPVEAMVQARAQLSGRRTFVRRVLARGRPLPAPPRALLAGPHVISGGWWRAEICRRYHFAEDDAGRWLWVYYDERRGRWYEQGRVE